MTIQEILSLVRAGYTSEQIHAFEAQEQSEQQAAADQQQVNDHQDPAPEPENPQPQQNQPDIAALVAEEVKKAMQLVNVHSAGVEEPDKLTPEQALFEGVFGPPPK